MNKSKLKSYAPAARREFIQAVTDRAHFYGLSENTSEIQPVEEKGDVAFIGGRPFPRKIAAQRKNLEQRIEREGFSQVMEAIAYTWFNRLLALRYMEIHGYLDHGFRVLSNPSGNPIPEILEQAAHFQLPGLDKDKVVELKLDGNKDAELYRMMLVAQCNALNTAMPFLFERIDDETELLFPNNLLHSDSLIRKLVTEIDEEDWQQVEIIGWLYQFYISEKKDQVIGKVVKPEDIPAATQLFTPNWIVKYMVQNSLGRMWLATYPKSSLKGKMEYYIEPAEQTEEVKAQLAAITPKELNPETITLLDPASGSGHILIEAYDLFKEIYLERGYRSRDIPRLILEKNLYGLDIDDRAAQMTGFALLMKARADDRNILRENPPRLNVMAIQGSEGIDAESISNALLKEKTYSIVNGPSTLFPETILQPVLTATHMSGIDKNDIRDLLELFSEGKAFGSLIQVPKKIAGKLNKLANLVESSLQSPDMFIQKAANTLLPFVRQAMVLAGQYNCVVANPPYMGKNYYYSKLKAFSKTNYPSSHSDLYSMFIERNSKLTKPYGMYGMITIPNWMFLSSFSNFRAMIQSSLRIQSLIHNGRGVFGSDFGSCSFVIFNCKISKYIGRYKRLFDKSAAILDSDELANRFISGIGEFTVSQDEFDKIPGYPIAYWLKDSVRDAFSKFPAIGNDAKKGTTTGENARFLRQWYEVDKLRFSRFDGSKWFPMTKGGEFRKWYGNFEAVIDWENDGLEIRNFKDEFGQLRSRPQNLHANFKEAITWNDVSIAMFSARYVPEGFVFNAVGPMIVGSNLYHRIAMLNSVVNAEFLKFLCPTMKFEVGAIALLPIADNHNSIAMINAEEAIKIAITDWDYFEISWDFNSFPCLSSKLKASSVETSWQTWQVHCISQITRMQELETENNRIFIEAYGLQDELSPEVIEDQITLARPDREADVKKLISYAVGCMMGRYSLDQPGLIYANSGSVDFDNSKYKTFPADDDGIIPVMDMDWFEDDAASRFEEFLIVAWSAETLEDNLKFVADSLSPKNSETSHETIRRYISTQFYKDHMQTYKKRPIYWLFSSGKQRAFECLVYLHRYNESTLSRMRNEYVTPLQGKFSARAEYLNNEINAATSTSNRTKLQKQLDTLKKKQAELVAFDDLLRHYADKRIPLDLDDGVKINYGKFGNLLAEVKAITGGGEE